MKVLSWDLGFLSENLGTGVEKENVKRRGGREGGGEEESIQCKLELNNDFLFYWFADYGEMVMVMETVTLFFLLVCFSV